MSPDAPGTSPTAEGFSPDLYWEDRLRDTWGFAGVGLTGQGRRFNEILYRVRRSVFLREVASLPIRVGESDVLDIGSGAGFYVDLWAELGAKSVVGSDLTQVAVTNLGRTRPAHEFTKLDIGGETVPYEGASFDIVSVFDVFFHIVDDERFGRALSNIASLLRPGGWLIFSDALLTQGAGGSKRPVPPHIRWRSEREVRDMLGRAGFEAGTACPVFVILNPPIDTSSRVLCRVWSLISRVSAKGELAGTLIATLLYPLERALLRFTRSAPTTKMLAARLRAPSQ